MAGQLATHLDESRTSAARTHHEVGRPCSLHDRLRRDAEDGAVEENAAVGPQETRRRLPAAAAEVDLQRRWLQPHPQPAQQA